MIQLCYIEGIPSAKGAEALISTLSNFLSFVCESICSTFSSCSHDSCGILWYQSIVVRCALPEELVVFPHTELSSDLFDHRTAV